jgi:hypothetical protein
MRRWPSGHGVYRGSSFSQAPGRLGPLSVTTEQFVGVELQVAAVRAAERGDGKRAGRQLRAAQERRLRRSGAPHHDFHRQVCLVGDESLIHLAVAFGAGD